MKLNFIITLLAAFLFNGCIDRSAYDNIDLAGDQSFAVPLVDSKVSVSSIADKVDGNNTSVFVDTDGKLTVFYNGEVVRNNSTVLFPPIPGILDNVLPDTNSLLPLPFDPKYSIFEGVFGATNMFFRFKVIDADDYKVTVRIPDLVDKNGVSFVRDYEFTSDIDSFERFTYLTDIEGWTLTPIDNNIRFIYEAYNSQGERVKFDYAAMKVDQLVFAYVEGYFSFQVFDVEGSNIGVGLFDNWVRGGMDFENPRMSITVENAFGFPVRSRVDFIKLTTLTGEEFELESIYIDEGIDFGYPKVNEVGVVKSSGFTFDRDNSNLRQLFNEKVVNVSYDIDALANPDDDTSIVNFVDSSSYFSVNVSIEVPMQGKANDFTLKQDSKIDLSELNDVKSATFKSITSNEFPTDIDLQMYFKNAQGEVLDSLFSSGPILIEAGELGSNLKTVSTSTKEAFETFDEIRFANILNATIIETHVSLDNTEASQDPLWIYDEYEIGLKLGATLQLN
jgi:hypothetical protein